MSWVRRYRLEIFVWAAILSLIALVVVAGANSISNRLRVEEFYRTTLGKKVRIGTIEGTVIALSSEQGRLYVDVVIPAPAGGITSVHCDAAMVTFLDADKVETP
jgi:hypothetical protein